MVTDMICFLYLFFFCIPYCSSSNVGGVFTTVTREIPKIYSINYNSLLQQSPLSLIGIKEFYFCNSFITFDQSLYVRKTDVNLTLTIRLLDTKLPITIFKGFPLSVSIEKMQYYDTKRSVSLLWVDWRTISFPVRKEVYQRLWETKESPVYLLSLPEGIYRVRLYFSYNGQHSIMDQTNVFVL